MHARGCRCVGVGVGGPRMVGPVLGLLRVCWPRMCARMCGCVIACACVRMPCCVECKTRACGRLPLRPAFHVLPRAAPLRCQIWVPRCAAHAHANHTHSPPPPNPAPRPTCQHQHTQHTNRPTTPSTPARWRAAPTVRPCIWPRCCALRMRAAPPALSLLPLPGMRAYMHAGLLGAVHPSSGLADVGAHLPKHKGLVHTRA